MVDDKSQGPENEFKIQKAPAQKKRSRESSGSAEEPDPMKRRSTRRSSREKAEMSCAESGRNVQEPSPVETPKLNKKRREHGDPANCGEYVESMYWHHYTMVQCPDVTPLPYMTQQNEINPKMRAILVDWIVEVHYKFRLERPTLWLAVNLLDRYLAKNVVSRSNLQLVGVCALLIACKFEEIRPPEVHDCVYMTDYAYTRENILGMEVKILKDLDYQLCVPTGYHFLTKYVNTFDLCETEKQLAFYFAERNLQEYETLGIQPDVFSAAALYAAIRAWAALQGRPLESCWTEAHQTETKRSEAELLPLAAVILGHVREETVTASKRALHAAKRKYRLSTFSQVSDLPLLDSLGSGVDSSPTHRATVSLGSQPTTNAP
jgi:cyclin B